MHKGRVFFSLVLIGVGIYAAHSAMGWKFKAALFPLAVSIPLVILVAIQLVLEIFGKGKTNESPAMDLEFGADVPQDVARRRAVGAFIWVAGFILAVYLVGFPLAVPIFMFCYLSFQGRVRLQLSVTLTAVAWLFFLWSFSADPSFPL